MKVELLPNGRPEICERILRALPKWFGIEEAIQNYVRDVATLTTFIAKEDDVIGFLSIHLHNAYTAEIHVMGVLPQSHRRGAGRALLNAAETYLRARNFEFLTVKTLSPSRANAEYEITRAFYQAQGFRPVEEFKTLWGPENPCLMMIKSLINSQ